MDNNIDVATNSAMVYVEHLLCYARKYLSLSAINTFAARNALLDCLQLDSVVPAVDDCEKDLDSILAPLLEYAVLKGLCTEADAQRFGVKLVGLCMPSPQEVVDRFDTICLQEGVRNACDWFYLLCQKSGYIPAKAILRNPRWSFEGQHGNICVTINTAKPEKDPKEVAAAKAAPQTGYPQCMLCPSNMGYAGRAGYPARQTLRFIPIATQDNELWFMQYSPYSYFAHHCIFLSAAHQPMQLSEKSYARMLEFVRMFPYFFVGSNAPLPIVGGSILAHDHYQGGAKVHPMFARYLRKRYTNSSFPGVKIGIVDWYNSVIRMRCRDKDQLVKAVNYVNSVWSMYSDPQADIVSRTGDTPHNCITPIFRMERNEYYAELILRNNRTDEKHPYGIFHPTEDMHHIKKEAIGIIEVLGTFILPGRLKAEMDAVAELLCSQAPFDEKALADPANPICKHKDMVIGLIKAKGFAQNKEQADEWVRDYINDVCERILNCTAVFKNDEAGQAAFDRFMRAFGCTEYVFRVNEEEEPPADKTLEPAPDKDTAPAVAVEQPTTVAEPPAEPVKRKRGRPRKNPLPEQG